MGIGVGRERSSKVHSRFLCRCLFVIHFMTLLALALLLTFCLYSGHCCFLRCFQESMVSPSLSRVCSRNIQELLLVGFSPILSLFTSQHLAQYWATRWSAVMGADPVGWLVISQEVRLNLQKGSSVRVPAKGSSVYLRHYWAEGKGGVGEERSQQLSSSAPRQWETLGIGNLKS